MYSEQITYEYFPLKIKKGSCVYLFVNKKSSKVFASSGHILSNFPEDACCLATGSPMERTLRREDTASFHVLSEGHEYFRLRGILSVCKMKVKTKFIVAQTNLRLQQVSAQDLGGHCHRWQYTIPTFSASI